MIKKIAVWAGGILLGYFVLMHPADAGHTAQKGFELGGKAGEAGSTLIISATK